MTQGPDAERRLDWATKLFYGFGTVAYGVKENGFSYLLLLFPNSEYCYYVCVCVDAVLHENLCFTLKSVF